MVNPARVLMQVRDAISHLNPREVREDAARPFTIQLYAPTPQEYAALERWFLPGAAMTDARRAQTAHFVRPGGEYAHGTVIRVVHQDLKPQDGDFVFRLAEPQQVVEDILAAHPELKLSLSKHVAPFRPQVTRDIIFSVSKENALFSLATAMPSILPVISLPWAVGEFASDTAFLTANQIRMGFMLAAASDRKIGYREQKAEIGSMFAGAFGWRAIARELAGKIPMGGGLVPKAAIAFAGTWVVGASLERLYRVGYGYTEAERHDAYEAAFQQGKDVAGALVRSLGARGAR